MYPNNIEKQNKQDGDTHIRKRQRNQDTSEHKIRRKHDGDGKKA